MSDEHMKSFTREYDKIVKKITIDTQIIAISAKVPGSKIAVKALLATGAERSAISPKLAKSLEMFATGITKIVGVGVNNTGFADLVRTTVILPERIKFSDMTILVCNLIPGVDMIIGMDIITSSDIQLTHTSGKSKLTFSIPSHSTGSAK
jgi:hypothetical protein